MSDLTNSVKPNGLEAASMNASSKKDKQKSDSNTANNTKDVNNDKLGLSNPALWYSGGSSHCLLL